MRKLKNKAEKAAIKAKVTGMRAKEKARGILTDNRGEGFVDTALV